MSKKKIDTIISKFEKNKITPEEALIYIFLFMYKTKQTSIAMDVATNKKEKKSLMVILNNADFKTIISATPEKTKNITLHGVT